MTRRIIDTAYRPQARAPRDQPANYTRTLLILALAAAGLGDLDQAVTAGTAALDCGRVVWPTMVLAGQLDRILARRFPDASAATDFHARYLDAGTRLALPAPRLRPGRGHSGHRRGHGALPGMPARQLHPAQPAVPVLNPQRPAAPGALALDPVTVTEGAAGPAPYLLQHSPGQAVGAAAGQGAGRVPGPAHLRAAAGNGRPGAWA
jgi:hypothetical protein